MPTLQNLQRLYSKFEKLSGIWHTGHSWVRDEQGAGYEQKTGDE